MFEKYEDELKFDFKFYWKNLDYQDMCEEIGTHDKIYLYHIASSEDSNLDLPLTHSKLNVDRFMCCAPSIIQCVAGIANYSKTYEIYRTKHPVSTYIPCNNEPDYCITQEVLYKPSEMELIKIGKLNNLSFLVPHDYDMYCLASEENIDDTSLKYIPNLSARAIYADRFNQIDEYKDMVYLQKEINWLSQWISDEELDIHNNNHTGIYR